MDSFFVVKYNSSKYMGNVNDFKLLVLTSYSVRSSFSGKTQNVSFPEFTNLRSLRKIATF